MTWASRPPSMPSGSASPLYARSAMSSISAPFSGSPLTYQRPFSHARSSGRVSSIVAAISRALPRTLRAAPDGGPTDASAARERGVVSAGGEDAGAVAAQIAQAPGHVTREVKRRVVLGGEE